MTKANSNTERLYSLLGDLSPDLLTDAFPEGANLHNTPSFRARHARRIGKMIALYAASVAVLVGAVIFVPKLMDWLLGPIPAASAMDGYYTEDGEWDVTKLSPAANARNIYYCAAGTLDDPLICLSEERTLSLTLTAQHQGTETAPYSHTVGSIRIEVLLDGEWYTLPSPVNGLQAVVSGKTELVAHGDSTHIRIPLAEEDYGDLPTGHYRVAVDLSVTHLYAYRTSDSFSGSVYTSFTVTKAPDAPFSIDGEWLTEGLLIAPLRKEPDCIKASTDTPSLRLSESRRFHVMFDYASQGNHRNWSENTHSYLKGEVLLLEVYLNGQWYTIPSTMSNAATEEFFGNNSDMEFILPEEYAQTFPTGKYRAVFPVKVSHLPGNVPQGTTDIFNGAIYVPFEIVNTVQDRILYANRSYIDPWYDYSEGADPARPLGKVYKSGLSPYDTTNPNARYVLELSYIDSDYTRRPMDEYLAARGFARVEHELLSRYWVALTEAELATVTPESVQEYYGLDTAPAVTVIHMEEPNYETGKQPTLPRVDLIWGQWRLADDVILSYGRIRIMEGLDTAYDWYPAATADQRFAVSATIVVNGQTVSAADYFRSLGWEILPDELHRVQTSYFPDTTETVPVAVTREQIYSVTLEDIAAFYGCDAKDVGVTFIGAVHK